MGLFDALRTRRPDEASTSSASSADALAAAQNEELSAAAAAVTAQADAASTLGALEAGASGGRLYNPYEGLATAIDGRGLRGTYRLPTQVSGRKSERGSARRVDLSLRARAPTPGRPARPHTSARPCGMGDEEDSGRTYRGGKCFPRRGARERKGGAVAPPPGRPASHRKPPPPSPLPSQPEFLFAEEAAVHRRSWSENLTYYTGAGYLAGAALGGSQGAAAALRAGPPSMAAAGAGLGGGAAGAAVFTDTPRLRVNRLLNTAGRAGRGAGNAAGALGLLFSATESAALAAADGRVPDAMPTVGAGEQNG